MNKIIRKFSLMRARRWRARHPEQVRQIVRNVWGL